MKRSSRPQVNVYELDTSATLAELEAVVPGLTVIAEQTGSEFCVVVSGYDDDPRELRDIPEVQQLCQRMIHSGFLAVMVADEDLPEQGFMSADMCFFIARGIIAHRGEWVVTPEVEAEFVRTLAACTARAAQLVEALVKVR